MSQPDSLLETFVLFALIGILFLPSDADASRRRRRRPPARTGVSSRALPRPPAHRPPGPPVPPRPHIHLAVPSVPAHMRSRRSSRPPARPPLAALGRPGPRGGIIRSPRSQPTGNHVAFHRGPNATVLVRSAQPPSMVQRTPISFTTPPANPASSSPTSRNGESRRSRTRRRRDHSSGR